MTCVLGLDVDQHTADLLVQLQLEDGDRYFESSKGKSREPTDEEVAFQLQEEDLKILSQILSDKRMAMSIANAVQSDGEIVAENQTTEENAARDRRLARDWTGDGGPVAVAVADSQLSAESSALDDEALYKLQIAYMFGLKDTQEKVDAPTTDTPTDEAESSKFAAKRTRPSSSLVHRCIACRNEIKPIDMINAPCDHEYCLSCLEGLFKASMIDESLFPPRCCGTAFDMENVRTMLKSDLIQDFERKQIEFESTNKTYCHSTVCSSFIPSSRIMGEVATCPDCELKTCTNCKSESHLDDCPRDTALQQLLLTAQENGWQRCHSCSRVIELNVGCNHMTLVALLFLS